MATAATTSGHKNANLNNLSYLLCTPVRSKSNRRLYLLLAAIPRASLLVKAETRTKTLVPTMYDRMRVLWSLCLI